LFKAKTGLLILGASLFFALAISPLVNKLADIIPGEGRKLPIALSYIIVTGFVASFIAIVVPTIFNETQRFVSSLPEIFNNASFNLSFIDNIGKHIGIYDLRAQIGTAINDFSVNFIREFGNNLATTLGTVSSIVTSIILILVLGFFMLVEGPDIMRSFWSNFRTRKYSAKIRTIATRMGQVVSKYVSNAITVSLINAVFTTITVFILSLCFGFSSGLALPFGLITGIMSLIPMFGSLIGGILVSILLAFNTWPAGLIFLVYTVIYLQIESNVISPKIQGKGLKLPALIVLASVTIGIYMFGLIGAIISIPIAGCVKVLLEELGDGFLPSPEKPSRKRKLIAKTEKKES
jgi:predicted PurR-regulated permease PerM